MALGKYNRRTVMADSGAVISGATVYFYDQTTGLPVTAYSDPDGLNPVGSSIQSGNNGEVEVFLPPGKYRITTELGSYSDEITYEPIAGDLAVINATDVTNGLFLLDAPAETSFIRVFANGYSDLRTTAQVKIDLGLGNVNNTSDVDKPVSTATQLALDLKANLTDPRFTDSREWTALTIDQTEAETGTATTRRAWTAQRVRQAIVAWWNTVGTTVGRAIFALTNPSAIRFLRINADNSVTARSATEMRTDLGLGTAATLNTGTTAGTVATGDDARLSDAREWTAATVDQVEAETGTATNRRAWTAERVRQSAIAWWNGSADKTKLDGLNVAVPSGPTDTGEPGQMAGDADYIYRCVATDTWIRVSKDASWA